MRILLVEDDDSVGEALTESLEDNDDAYQVLAKMGAARTRTHRIYQRDDSGG